MATGKPPDRGRCSRVAGLSATDLANPIHSFNSDKPGHVPGFLVETQSQPKTWTALSANALIVDHSAPQDAARKERALATQTLSPTGNHSHSPATIKVARCAFHGLGEG